MNIEIHLPPMFRHISGVKDKVSVSGGTVGECLAELVRLYPDLREALLTDGGAVRPGIAVFLNGENAYPDEPRKTVRDGDTIHIAQMVLGG